MKPPMLTVFTEGSLEISFYHSMNMREMKDQHVLSPNLLNSAARSAALASNYDALPT